MDRWKEFLSAGIEAPTAASAIPSSNPLLPPGVGRKIFFIEDNGPRNFLRTGNIGGFFKLEKKEEKKITTERERKNFKFDGK